MDGQSPQPETVTPPKKQRKWLRRIGWTFLVLVVLLGIARLFMPMSLRWYVNRTIDQNPMYDGKIGDIRVHLWRGAYSIEDIRLMKTTGTVPVPLFFAKRLDLAVEWGALLNGKVVGRLLIDQPELNFVDGDDDSEDQTGGGGPWLDILSELFPFTINSCEIQNGSIHFRAYGRDPVVDVYMSQLNAKILNLTNVRDEVTPLISTVEATGMVLDHAQMNYEMKFDPFSYRPTFQMAIKLIGLDVTKTNDLARAYGQFDFEAGWFDLVVEITAREGQLKGYVKPLFRNLKVFSIRRDIAEDNVLAVFWEAVVGGVSGVLKNPSRDQVGTMIPLTGDMSSPDMNILEVIGNVLQNAFVRAYLPRLEGASSPVDGMQFGNGSVTDPDAPGNGD